MRNLLINSAICALLVLTLGCKTTQEQEAVAESPKKQITNTPGSMKAPITEKLPPMKLEKTVVEQVKLHSGADSLFASIKRTPCYGRCPIYEAKIYNSGFVVYEGKRFVDKEGVFTSRISSEQLSQILSKASELRYFELQDEYDSPVTDLPTTYTSVQKEGVAKLVKNRVGGPDNLKAFESFLDGILNGASWIKKSDSVSH